MKLTKTQKHVLKKLSEGEDLCEYLTLDSPYRSLGNRVTAKLNYIMDGKRLSYDTFRALFNKNLITQKLYRGSPSPQDGITGWKLTELGWDTAGLIVPTVKE
jgi:hypothetical protein